jgi:hypothetical protein
MGRLNCGAASRINHHDAKAMIAVLDENRQCLSAKTKAAGDELARRVLLKDG